MLTLTFLKHIKAQCVQEYGDFEAALYELGYSEEALNHEACKQFEPFKDTSENGAPLFVQILATTAAPAASSLIRRAEFKITR